MRPDEVEEDRLMGTQVLANVGLPMLFMYGPILLLALGPIIVVEALVYRLRLSVSVGRSLGGSALANLVSTILGVPLTWVVLVVLQILTGGTSGTDSPLLWVTWQAPWLFPYEEHLHWMIPAAGFVLTIPFFVVSVWIERFVLYRAYRGHADSAQMERSVLLANGITYGLLAVGWLGMLLLAAQAA
jgi:hypothetical protein